MEKAARVGPVVADTGILYALADRKDSWHERAAGFLSRFRGRLLVPVSVIPETCYLLNSYLGPASERAFVASLAAREVSVENLAPADLARAVELMETYADADIGFVDASLVAVAERLKISRLLTTDRRHFSLIRPAHCRAFTLLP